MKPDSERTPLGLRVRKRRNELKLTQEELAFKAGVRLRVLAGIECGITKDPKQETLRKIAVALAVTLDHLMGRTDPPARKSARPKAVALEPLRELLGQTA
jgi:transcriptional regulator with XRE-family HTH domain